MAKSDVADDEGFLIPAASLFHTGDVLYRMKKPANHQTRWSHAASFIVTKLMANRNVMLLLFAGDKIKPAGKVTIPPDHDIPNPGTVVECRYLHASKDSCRVQQPFFLGVRNDIRAVECTTAQLKIQRRVRV